MTTIIKESLREEAKVIWRDAMEESIPLIYTPMNNWIKTSEQLPPFQQIVLGINSDGVRVVRFELYHPDYSMDKKYFVINVGEDGCGCCNNFDENITHWMPLPELPNES